MSRLAAREMSSSEITRKRYHMLGSWHSTLPATRRPLSPSFSDETIDRDRYPLSPRLAPFRAIMAKLDTPQPRPEPQPPLKPTWRRLRSAGASDADEAVLRKGPMTLSPTPI
jgi:hypothetical protein